MILIFSGRDNKCKIIFDNTGSMKKNSSKIVTGLTLIEHSWGPSLRWHLDCEQDKEKDPSL